MKTSIILALTTPSLFAGSSSILDSPVSESVATSWRLSSVSAGPSWRTFGGLDYRGSSRSQNLIIPSIVGESSITLPAIGTETNLFDREYNDGYVRQDGLTADSGDTWYWGYDSASQIQGNQIVFQATGFQSVFSEVRSFSPAEEFDRDLRGFSPQVDFLLSPPSEYDLPFHDFLLSFWHFNAEENKSFSNFRIDQDRNDFRIDFVDRFELNGIIPPLAPFEGSLVGPGPLIPNAPGTDNRSQTSTLIDTETATFSNLIKTDLDLDAFSLAIGPTLEGRFEENWNWRTSFGVSINYYHWKASESETLSLSRNSAAPTLYANWEESESDSKFRLGLFAKGEIIRNLQNDWFASASAQVDLVEDFKIRIGESSYTVSPSGFSLGLSIGKSF